MELEFLGQLSGIDNVIRDKKSTTPAPDWAKADCYSLEGERKVRSHLDKLKNQIDELRVQEKAARSDLQNAANLKGLLFETGKSLEAAVIECLELIGFVAAGFRDEESEFDILFEDPEGNRFIGEAEGKNDKPINIDKLSQLERNVQEDFQKDSRDNYARPVLFGNVYRLTAPDERDDFFTSKCKTGAARVGAVLVRTSDLFTVSQYLQESKDQDFAALCRRVFVDCAGKVASFPPFIQAARH